MLRFTQVDVFTDRLTEGNPVAVVHDADGLTTETMTAFARWTNLSETAFLQPPDDPAADYRVRIFTPSEELPFAGHPTLGSAAAWLAAGGEARHADELVQQCAAGLIRVRRTAGRLAFAAPPLVRSGPLSAVEYAQLSAVLDLPPEDIVDVQWADNGPGWVAILLPDADAVLAMTAPARAISPFRGIGVVGAYPPGGEVAFEVRAFHGQARPFEDPVTGSVNAALAQWLIPAGLAPSEYVASQGTVLGHRGRVHVHDDGRDMWVGGDTVLGITGTVALT